MPLVLVTDTDVAAVPFGKSKPYSFRLDAENRGPYAGMVPLSHVLDPAKEQASVESLAGQFANIPYTDVRDAFLNEHGPTYMANAVHKAEQYAAGNPVADKMLREAMAHPEAIFYENRVTEAIKGYAKGRSQTTAEGLIDHFVQERGIPREHAPYQLVDDIMRTRILEGREVQAALKTGMAHTDNVAAGAAAKAAQVKRFADCLPAEAGAKLADALHKGADDMPKILGEGFNAASAQQRDAMVGVIEEAAGKYGLQGRKVGLLDVAREARNDLMRGRGLKFSLDEVKAAQSMTADPAAAAREHFDAMKAEAAAKKILPEVPAAQYEAAVARVMDATPSYVAKAADASHMRVVIVPEGVRINDITPNSAGMMVMSELGGGSTGHGIYAKASLLNKPTVTKEEIVHEVERYTIPVKGGLEPFSLQEPWKKAIALDMAEGANNPLYQHVTKQPILFDEARRVQKSNNTIGPFQQPVKANDADVVKFMEAVPDVYHYEDIVRKELAEKGAIKMKGTGWFGTGGKKYTTVDEVMHEIFPNAWPMLQGPKKGMKLVQDASGKVAQVAHATAEPAGTAVVASLRECCDRSLVREVEAGAEALAKAPRGVVGAFTSMLTHGTGAPKMAIAIDEVAMGATQVAKVASRIRL